MLAPLLGAELLPLLSTAELPLSSGLASDNVKGAHSKAKRVAYNSHSSALKRHKLRSLGESNAGENAESDLLAAHGVLREWLMGLETDESTVVSACEARAGLMLEGKSPALF